MAQYTLYDLDNTQIQFEGRLLAHVSTEPPVNSKRWSVIDIYKTEGGTYIVHKIGMTRVTGENTRYSLHMSETPEGAVESAHASDSNGAVFLPRFARAALAQASLQDDGIRKAFQLRKVM